MGDRQRQRQEASATGSVSDRKHQRQEASASNNFKILKTRKILSAGYAHTFLNADQGRYAGHLIQALEFSECPVPAQLKILWEEYVTARKAEGKDVSTQLQM